MINEHRNGSVIREVKLIGYTILPVPVSLPESLPGVLSLFRGNLVAVSRDQGQHRKVLVEAASPMQASHFNNYSIFNIYTISPGLIWMLHYTKATFTLIMGMFIQKGKKARTFDFSLCHISFPCNYFLKHEISESQKLEVDCTSLNLRGQSYEYMVFIITLKIKSQWQNLKASVGCKAKEHCSRGHQLSQHNQTLRSYWETMFPRH